MKKLNSHNNLMSFDSKRKELHQKDLNLEVPKAYFSRSKKEILSKTIDQHKQSKVITMPNFYHFSAAIAILMCLGGTISLYQYKSSNELVAVKDVENELLLSALFENDTRVEELTTSYMLGDLEPMNQKIN